MPKGTHRKHTPTELAYLAGIVDGEGYIGIDSCYKRKGKPHNYQLRMGVINTNLKLIEWIKNNFGGSMSKREKPKSVKHKQCYQWRMEAKLAGKLIRKIYPYLIIKKERAELGLKFRKTFEEGKPVLYFHRNGRFVDSKSNPELKPIRQKMREQMLFLNKRGPVEVGINA